MCTDAHGHAAAAPGAEQLLELATEALQELRLHHQLPAARLQEGHLVDGAEVEALLEDGGWEVYSNAGSDDSGGSSGYDSEDDLEFEEDEDELADMLVSVVAEPMHLHKLRASC